MKQKQFKTAGLSLKLEPEIKTALEEKAIRKGMDLSKLARAILTNWISPNTYNI